MTGIDDWTGQNLKFWKASRMNLCSHQHRTLLNRWM